MGLELLTSDYYIEDFAEYNSNLDTAIYKTRSLFGEHRPFHERSRIDGSIVIFNPHFIKAVRYALSSGKIVDMGPEEERLLMDFIAYQNTGLMASRNNRESGNLVELLDNWLINETDCAENYTDDDYATHIWDECPNKLQ